MNISVVIPVYNQAHLTERCLVSLLENSLIAKELFVVDNNSTDTTSILLKKFQQKFSSKGWNMQIISNHENVGFGRACNQGIRASSGDHVVILNNDTWLMPGWDEALLRRLNDLNADMVGPYYDESAFDAENTPKMAKKFVSRNRNKSSIDFVAILMFFRRATLDEIGLFDERFFVTSEDDDLRVRMERAGKRYFQVGDCYIWHHSSGTRHSQKLPSNFEEEGLRLFIEKWGFDHRGRNKTIYAKVRRKWRKIKASMGLF